MNLDAWVPLIGLAIATALIQAAAATAKLGRLQEPAQWIAGVAALLLMLQAGVYATQTWIGKDLVPLIADVHPIVPVAAGFVLLVAPFVVLWAAAPSRLTTLAVTSLVTALAFVAPLLVQFAPEGWAGDGARGLLETQLRISARVTDGMFE